MASVLVIGGSGFFGKSIADAFRRGLLGPWKIDHLVLAARSASTLARTHRELLTPGVELMDMDIATTEHLPQADYVIHAAATTDARRYLTAPLHEKANILAATYHFCELATRDLVNSKIVYTSSGAVYGTQPPDLAQLTEQFSLEQTVMEMVSHKRDYAAAKRDAEALILQLGRAGLAVSIARCFAFVGCYLPRDQHFAIGNFIANGLANEVIVVNATTPVIRSYMYADDLVRWLMSLAAHASSDCPTWNVGSEQAITIVDLATMLGNQFGVPVQIGPQSPKPIDRYVPSVAKARGAGMQHLDLKAAIDQTLIQIRARAEQQHSE